MIVVVVDYYMMSIMLVYSSVSELLSWKGIVYNGVIRDVGKWTSGG